MIETTYFAKYFTELLNKYGADYGKHFKVFADEGELKKATKNYDEAPKDYTSGIIEVISSSLVPIRDIRLNTYSLQITLFVDLALNGFTDEKESLNLVDVKKVLTELIDDNNGKTSFYGGKPRYNQTITFDYPTNGQRTDLGFISDCMPIYLSCNVSMFQDGLNANDCSIILNGENISFTRAVFTRKRTADSQTFNGDGSQKTIIQSNGLSVDLVFPLTDNQISRLFLQDVLNGGNFAINVEIKTPFVKKYFIGAFGDAQASMDIATNVGGNLSIVEAKENLLEYSNKWRIENVVGNVEITANENDVIYWGDGTSEKATKQGNYEHIYSDGKTNHTVRIFGG